MAELLMTCRPGSDSVEVMTSSDSPTPKLNARYAALTTAGHVGELEPFDAFWGQRYATVKDPNGNGVDFYAALG